MIVHTDGEGWVTGVEHEPSDAMVNSVMREVERADMPPLKTQICKGPWHYKAGKGTSLPIDQFPMNRYRKGERTKTCAECLEKSGKRSQLSEREAETIRMNKIVEARVPVTPEPNEPFNGGMQFKWRIVHLNPVESIVYAKDYREAGEQVQGPVISVERLD